MGRGTLSVRAARLSSWRALLLAAVAMLPACSLREGWKGPISDHFDGKRFSNDEPFETSLLAVLRFYLSGDTGPWTRDLDEPPAAAPAASVGEGRLVATVVNHATVLVQADGLNILTDPVWSQRVSPLSWIGPRRYRPPAIRFEDLPPIDVVLISHNHYDHLDLATVARLAEHHDPAFVVPLGDAEFLRGIGIKRVVELDWWQAWTLPNGRQIHGVPVQHWSGRSVLPSDQNRSLWQGYVIETAAGPVYFAGDTGYADHFERAHERFGNMRLALLPIGAYEPRWFLAYQHMNPAEAVQAHLELRAQTSLAIHWGTFKLTAEGQLQPRQDLIAARRERGLSDVSFQVPDFGEAIEIAPLTTETGG